RRRHTRFSRDWSSDVCSSDLVVARLDDGTGDAEFNADDPDAEKWKKIALGESRYDKFYYEDTPVAHKVAQHFGDSAKFDEAPYEIGRASCREREASTVGASAA